MIRRVITVAALAAGALVAQGAYFALVHMDGSDAAEAARAFRTILSIPGTPLS